MWGDAVSVCTGIVWVAEPWPEEVAWRKDSLLGILEEWLLLATGDDGTLITGSFSQEERWDICKITYT